MAVAETKSKGKRMNRTSTSFLICVMILEASQVAAQTADFSGEWETSFGPLTVAQDGETVHGEYEVSGQPSTLEGTVQGPVLDFKYREGPIEGIGRFQLSDDGRSFTGRWTEQDTDDWYTWIGGWRRGSGGLPFVCRNNRTCSLLGLSHHGG